MNMGNLHRIQWIDAMIRENRFPNCTTIAREFCISTRQASRDVEYLKYSLGAPLEYDSERKGYYYTGESFALPSFRITEDEKTALAYLAERYRESDAPESGGEMTVRLAMLFERLAGAESTPHRHASRHEEHERGGRDRDGSDRDTMRGVFPVFTVGKKLLEITKALEDAVRNGNKTRLVYLDSGNRKTTRMVRPYVVFLRNGTGYLHGWCELRGAERDFRIDRMRSVVVLADRFELPASFDTAEFERGMRFEFRSPYRATIAFEDRPRETPPTRTMAAQRPALSDSIGRRIRVVSSSFDGRIDVEFRSSNELIAALTETGRPFSILSPVWLREKCVARLSEILEKNSRL
jgi:predicted DNA-binding transcriptional regulator YafY